MKTFNELLDKLLKEPEFEREYQRIKPGYDFLLNLIKTNPEKWQKINAKPALTQRTKYKRS